MGSSVGGFAGRVDAEEDARTVMAMTRPAKTLHTAMVEGKPATTVTTCPRRRRRARTPSDAADTRAMTADSMRNCSRMSLAACAERFADADFPGALRDRDQHDVHDDDAADDQRDQRDGAQHRAEGVGELAWRSRPGCCWCRAEKESSAPGASWRCGAHQHADFIGRGSSCGPALPALM